jgi:hypothetical protein
VVVAVGPVGMMEVSVDEVVDVVAVRDPLRVRRPAPWT